MEEERRERRESIDDLLNELNKKEKEVASEIDEDYDDFIEGNQWFKDDKGMYYKFEDGKKKPYIFDDARYDNDCARFMDMDICDTLRGLIGETIRSVGEKEKLTHINKLADFLQNIMTMQYAKFKKIINEIHPAFILLILRSFGFTMNEDTKEIHSVEYWLKNIIPKYYIGGMTSDRFYDENRNLIHFLSLLVAFINANPGILNRESVYDFAEYEKRARSIVGESDTIIDGFGKPIRDRVYNIPNANYTNILRYVQNSIITNKRRYNLNPMLYLRFRPAISGLYVPGYNGTMFGGGNCPSVQVGGVYYQYQVQQLNNMNGINCGTRFANMLYQKLSDRLGSFNKKLHEKDVKHFQAMLKNLKTHEEKMYKWLTTYGDYVQNTNNYSIGNSNVTFNDMKKFVEGLKIRGLNIWNQEEKIVGALLKIANFVDSIGNATGTTNSVPIPI